MSFLYYNDRYLFSGNIHPTKREVAFLHADALCEALVAAVKTLLFSSSTRTFHSQTLLTGQRMAPLNVNSEKNVTEKLRHPQPCDKPESSNALDQTIINDVNGSRGLTTDKDVSDTLHDQGLVAEDTPINQPLSYKTNSSGVQDQTYKKAKTSNQAHQTVAKKPYDPKNLVRVVQQQGALEPYLAPKDSKRSGTDATDTVEETWSNAHLPFCEFSSQSKAIDMSIPGAFATVICRCQVGRRGKFSAAETESIIKPKKVVPTSCNLESIRKLRLDVIDSISDLWTTKIRGSLFVGCVSRHRSLVQWGVELILVHMTNLARELFYQLALTRFSGSTIALIDEGGVNVQSLIEYALQFEENCAIDSAFDGQVSYRENDNVTINDTNKDLASHATKCLAENGKMAMQFFGMLF